MKILSVGAGLLHADGRTDTTKPLNNFRDFSNAPKILVFLLLGNFFANCIGFCVGDKIEKNEMGWACGAYG